MRLSIHVDCVRWIHLPVPVGSCNASADAIDLVRAAIEEAVAREAQGRLLACRIELIGQTKLHGQLLASADRLLAEARAAALGLGEETAGVSIDPHVVRGIGKDHGLGQLGQVSEAQFFGFHAVFGENRAPVSGRRFAISVLWT
jgi:hypothetical protein